MVCIVDATGARLSFVCRALFDNSVGRRVVEQSLMPYYQAVRGSRV